MITIKFRRDTSAKWEKVNPLLASGEPGYEKDTGKFKIGDGVYSWNDLGYFTQGDNAALYAELMMHVNSVVAHPSTNDDGISFLLLYENAKV